MSDSKARYFNHVRADMMRFVPRGAARLLEIGCGAGGTMAALRERQAVQWAGGVEYVPEAAEQAKAAFDKVWCIDAETTPFEGEIPPASLDAILCFDVLEHLVDPWSLVKRLTALLAQGGCLVVSVPNIRHWKFVRDLLFRGDFRYRDAGLLDRTHLRFFVRETAIELVTCGGLELAHVGPAKQWRSWSRRWLLSRLTFHAFDALAPIQFALVAQKR